MLFHETGDAKVLKIESVAIPVPANGELRIKVQAIGLNGAEIMFRNGVELVFDPIGGPIVNQLADAAAQGGRIIEYGALDSEITPFPLFTALAKGLIIQGYTIFEISQNEAKLNKAKQFLLPLFESNKLIPVLDKEFYFDDIQPAHEYMESNQQVGKIIVNL